MTTQKEDAESIVGEELAKLLEEESELVGKSEALVIKADTQKCPNCGKDMVNGKCPECDKEDEAAEPKKADIEIVEDAISARKDVNPKEGENKYGDVTFADEKNKKYPIDTEEHIRAAWNYINKPKNSAKYSPDEVAQIKSKIIAAWKSKIDKEGPPSASEKADYEDADIILEAIYSLQNTMTLPKPEEKPAHVLDEIFATFRADFDSVLLSDTTPEEKLQALQPNINAVASRTVELVKSLSKPISPEKEQENTIAQLSDAVSKLSQQITIMAAQLDGVSKPAPVANAPIVPARRSIDPALVAQNMANKVQKSETPKLRAMIERSVGISS